jgi:hypothetical protein
LSDRLLFHGGVSGLKLGSTILPDMAGHRYVPGCKHCEAQREGTWLPGEDPGREVLQAQQPAPSKTWATQCEAINADDGRRCGLLKGHDAVDAAADEAEVMAMPPASRDAKRFELAQRRWHRSARGPFTRAAPVGQQSFPERERLDQFAQARGAPHAHAGDDTTTGLERPSTQESA